MSWLLKGAAAFNNTQAHVDLREVCCSFFTQIPSSRKHMSVSSIKLWQIQALSLVPFI
jgi:hypothetical protein